MRDLEKNKVSLWKVDLVSITDEVDINGYKTGQKKKTYSTPTQIRLSLYPSDGDIALRLFGQDCNFDMITSSVSNILTKDSLLFKVQPTANFSTTYDYNVAKISESLNVHLYGLNRRV